VELEGIRIEHTVFQLLQGPFTLEDWVNSVSNEGRKDIVAQRLEGPKKPLPGSLGPGL
jgi:hypothetical protein